MTGAGRRGLVFFPNIPLALGVTEMVGAAFVFWRRLVAFAHTYMSLLPLCLIVSRCVLLAAMVVLLS